MIGLTLTLTPLTPFGTPPFGDTLFGQLCWALRRRFGEARLSALLDGYADGQPFAVLSDAFPAGYLPRPALPLAAFRIAAGADRKQLKRRTWIPAGAAGLPMEDWLAAAAPDSDAAGGMPFRREAVQPRNSIDRRTGTTGTGAFAPYGAAQVWYAPGARLDCHVVLDEQRLAGEDLLAAVGDMGGTGFGRDANVGMGKFSVASAPSTLPPPVPGADALLTLAPCAPQGCGFDPGRSFYHVFTRFGRHGDEAVLGGQPFKNPVLMARAGAVFAHPDATARRFAGRGLGGGGELSRALPATVQQAYAPVLAVRLPAAAMEEGR